MRFQLEKLRQERSKWNTASQKAAAAWQEQAEEATQAEREKYLVQVAQSRAEQFKLMTKAVALKLEGRHSHCEKTQELKIKSNTRCMKN